MKMNIKMIALALAGLFFTQEAFAFNSERGQGPECPADWLEQAQAWADRGFDEEADYVEAPKQEDMGTGEAKESGCGCCSKVVDSVSACVACVREHPVLVCGATAFCCACCGYTAGQIALAGAAEASVAWKCGMCSNAAYVTSGAAGLCAMRRCCGSKKEATDEQRLVKALKKVLNSDAKPKNQ
jgi:hypothetical protein